eukprot:CAMPEP_0172701674 /NCGR_PEP_ID=MMETSP1074-20121228/31801_1 /TAXON_ID=2916 /ORGANISM="Ceratium fusus, Strain PA161109" /LENGTH=626 /DNA_ID=CAMNT_0013523249 /DNA_START=43 /DNA_END=1923 /DNA_ORIENTATION=-
MKWIVSFCVFGVVAGNVKLCNLVAGTSTQKNALPSNILAANKLQFKGFQPVVKRALSATNDTYMEITGYSTTPQVQIGKDAIVSPKSCVESSGSNRLTPSWLPVACAVATAMLPSGSRMAAAVPILAWAQGVEASVSCTETVEVTIYTPPAAPAPPDLNAQRPGCQSQIAKNSTADSIVGGTLYVYDTTFVGSKWKKIAGKSYVDLADSSIKAGCVPKHKPHMVLPSPDGKHTIITYTGDQDYAVLRNSDFSVMMCPSVEFLKPKVFGGAVHTGAWFTKNTFLAVDMTGSVDGISGGAIHRHEFTYDGTGAMKSFTYKSSLGHANVAAARGTTATKPIAIGNNPSGAYSKLFFVTDAKGAGSIMNAETMAWDTHFNASLFGNCSGGGLWVVPHPDDPKIVLAQYGKQDSASCIFKIDMQAKTLTKLVQLADNGDAHGIQFCKTDGGELTIINTNRQTATLDVVKYSDGSFLLRDYDLNSQAFDAVQVTRQSEPKKRRLSVQQKKLQPDVVYLHKDYLYMAARGPKPVSAVKAQNFYANAVPGLMALKINTATCLPASSQSTAFVLPTWERSPEITSDVHSVWGVMNGGSMQIWTIDQAGTGSVQQLDVYSNCAAHGVKASDIHANP